jgi:phage portal protein BeeE
MRIPFVTARSARTANAVARADDTREREAKASRAGRLIAFGVPPMLLGIPGDNTYANYKEANAAFWRGTVLPLAAKLAGALSEWLAPAFGDDLRLWFDPDQVDALSGDREALWARVAAADFLTVNEKRAAVGYGAIDGGDALGPLTGK